MYDLIELKVERLIILLVIMLVDEFESASYFHKNFPGIGQKYLVSEYKFTLKDSDKTNNWMAHN